MNTYLTRWLVVCTFLCSLAINNDVLSIILEKEQGNSFELTESLKINEIEKSYEGVIEVALPLSLDNKKIPLDEFMDLTEQYGEFFLAELIESQDDQNNRRNPKRMSGA